VSDDEIDERAEFDAELRVAHEIAAEDLFNHSLL
jgi:hypothetical protein